MYFPYSWEAASENLNTGKYYEITGIIGQFKWELVWQLQLAPRGLTKGKQSYNYTSPTSI